MADHNVQLLETASRYATLGMGLGVTPVLQFLNDNAGAIGAVLAILSFMINIHYQKKLFRLRERQADNGNG